MVSMLFLRFWHRVVLVDGLAAGGPFGSGGVWLDGTAQGCLIKVAFLFYFVVGYKFRMLFFCVEHLNQKCVLAGVCILHGKDIGR